MKQNRSNNQEKGQRAGSARLSGSTGLLYVLIGGGIGATLALLFAPKSGADLRTGISEVTKRGYGESLELAGRLKEQSTGLLHTVKEKSDRVYDLAAAKLSRDRGGDITKGREQTADESLDLLAQSSSNDNNKFGSAAGGI